MTSRCDLSDLPVDQCACRLHGPKEPARAPFEPGVIQARTTAQFPGYCEVCEERFPAGTPLALLNRAWIHEECAA